MPQPKYIIITMEGGLVQDVLGLPKGYEAIKIDYDTRDCDPTDPQLMRWMFPGQDRPDLLTEDAEGFIRVFDASDAADWTQERIRNHFRDLIEKIKAPPIVDLIARAFDWTCPKCPAVHNHEDGYSAHVTCRKCNTTWEVGKTTFAEARGE